MKSFFMSLGIVLPLLVGLIFYTKYLESNAINNAVNFCKVIEVGEPVNQYIDVAEKNNIYNYSYNKSDYHIFNFNGSIFRFGQCMVDIEKGMVVNKKVYMRNVLD